MKKLGLQAHIGAEITSLLPTCDGERFIPRYSYPILSPVDEVVTLLHASFACLCCALHARDTRTFAGWSRA